MRKGAGGWLAKILLVLLVASFAVWGIGSDMLNSSATSKVIEVGEQSVSLGEFQMAYNRNVQNMSRQFQTQISPDMAKQLQLGNQTISQMVGQALLKENVRALDLAVNDEIVRGNITATPAFVNNAGQFDRLQFDTILRQNGYSEDSYIADIRSELETRQIVSSLNEVLSGLPKVAKNRIFAHQAEKRTAAYIELMDSVIATAAAPDDTALESFIKDNAAKYTAPEYRKIDYVLVAPENFTSQVEVSADELNAEYDGRRSEFFQPAQRAIQQMIFAKEAQAKEAAAKIRGGADFAATALEMLQLTKGDIDLGTVTKTDLLDELQEPVFTSAEGTTITPVKTILGWHVIKTTLLTPQVQKTFDAVKERLRKDISLRKASSLVYDASTRIEDELAGGSSLKELASGLGLKVRRSDWVDATGNSDLGAAVKGLPKGPEFLADAFAKNVGDESDLVALADSSYYVLAVTEIRASRLQTLNEVRQKATEAWQANWRHARTREKADKILTELNAGKPLDIVALDQSVTVKKSTPVLRSGRAGELSNEARNNLFAPASKTFSVSENQARNGYILYKLEEVIAVDIAKEQQALARLDLRLGSMLRNDILELYERHLRREYGVTVNEGLIREFF